MQVTLNIENSQIAETVGNLFENLTENQKSELTKGIMETLFKDVVESNYTPAKMDLTVNPYSNCKQDNSWNPKELKLLFAESMCSLIIKDFQKYLQSDEAKLVYSDMLNKLISEVKEGLSQSFLQIITNNLMSNMINNRYDVEREVMNTLIKRNN